MKGKKISDRKVHKEWYQIDYSKVKTFEDLLCLVKGMNMCFSSDGEYFEEVKHLLEDKPVDIPDYED